MGIIDIAAVITEDPDIFLDAVITEAPDSFYIPAFNKSQAPVPSQYNDVSAQTGALRDYAHKTWMVLDRGADSVRPLLIRELPAEDKLQILQLIKSVVNPQLVKFEPYYVNQVTSGNLPLHKIKEDSERLNNTVAMFVKMSRKAFWDGPKDIYKYPDWKILERKINEYADKFIDYDASQDSEILYTKKYVNNAISLLLGGPPEVTTYWFRAVSSPEAACKYGKGTTWCTSSEPAPRGTPAYEQHYFHTYHESDGLYIIEMQSPSMPRRPILQISGDQFMDSEDVPVSRVGPRMKDFLSDVLKHAAGKIRVGTVEALVGFSGIDRRSMTKHHYKLAEEVKTMFASHLTHLIEGAANIIVAIDQDAKTGFRRYERDPDWYDREFGYYIRILSKPPVLTMANNIRVLDYLDNDVVDSMTAEAREKILEIRAEAKAKLTTLFAASQQTV